MDTRIAGPTDPQDVDQERIAAAVREIIAAIGEDGTREGLAETPERIGRLYAELFSGLREDPLDVLRKGFDESHKEMVILKSIPFYSLCEHHFLPFHGEAHVGYVPEGRIVGVSKLARVVDILARRPQMQERLTSQVTDAIMEGLRPDGVAVVVQPAQGVWRFFGCPCAVLQLEAVDAPAEEHLAAFQAQVQVLAFVVAMPMEHETSVARGIGFVLLSGHLFTT